MAKKTDKNSGSEEENPNQAEGVKNSQNSNGEFFDGILDMDIVKEMKD